ncbi:helix-turn-helix domain-containing protein [Pedobacter agri]|uniref:Helix-turn-helix domain-containing protein n=1 Tax=Pedobacter agri TaxID=454586 RepID=A0A9X3DG04_9SPHI|nr:helix-turn-helix domain-containing protein [Pedobacter agri]MCX3266465.1 helix-turn-helix domain-containing protein [Pedobacter agri]
MNYVAGQFVALPRITKLNELKIRYVDILTYTALKSFNGEEGCFPSYESIAERATCSRNFIVASIKRLERSGLINIRKNRKRVVRDRLPVNEYTFKRYDTFNAIPYEIFDIDINLYDKAMLLVIQQFFYEGTIRPFYTLNRIASELGVSTKIVYQRFQSLVDLGYVTKTKQSKRRWSYGDKYTLSNEVKWIWDSSKMNVKGIFSPFLLVA